MLDLSTCEAHDDAGIARVDLVDGFGWNQRFLKRAPPAHVSDEVADGPMLVVEIEVIDRADVLAVSSVDGPSFQISKFPEHGQLQTQHTADCSFDLQESARRTQP